MGKLSAKNHGFLPLLRWCGHWRRFERRIMVLDGNLLDEGKRKAQKPKKFGLRWLLLLILCALIPMIYTIWTGFVLYTGFQPLEMAQARYTPKDVVGDLGGMKVVIPRHYAEYVEYDGDPAAFSGKRKGPTPERTFNSRLRSFGMDVRFPDMKGLENFQIRTEKRKQSIHENMWLSVGIMAGESYAGDGFLDRRASYIYKPGEYWWNNYKRLPDDFHGLEVYVVADLDPRTGKPGWESTDTLDVYIHRG
ncbi:MAG: hypothetical protein LBO00_06725 [Zoogloeaceae bacterium]|jgi:hypothetical protein|nr:hypothetical protein [Zoogloeaceae bacterium]